MDRNQNIEPGSRVARLGPMEIQQKEFRVTRFGGYKMRDVDEFLDELTASMSALIADNDRLRAQASGSPVVGSPDLDDVGRQADEIIQRARDEAGRIVADARTAAAATATIAAGTASDRGPVDAFLLQEREFLQGLGALVQGHAETVKRMARAARSAPSTAAEVVAAPEQVEPAPDEIVGDADAIETDEVPASPPQDPIVRVDEPAPAPAPAEGDADGSLRDLFWGEED